MSLKNFSFFVPTASKKARKAINRVDGRIVTDLAPNVFVLSNCKYTVEDIKKMRATPGLRYIFSQDLNSLRKTPATIKRPEPKLPIPKSSDLTYYRIYIHLSASKLFDHISGVVKKLNGTVVNDIRAADFTVTDVFPITKERHRLVNYLLIVSFNLNYA